ncbi:MAG: aminotransferase class III-fold pyridoxal phosphate-dependent enzyme [Thermodesulfobacteriota bacterium]
MSDSAKRITDFAAHSYHTWSRQKTWKNPILVKDAEGIYFIDDKGKRYIDLSSQLMCSNLGHKNKVVIDAILKQAEKLPYIAPGFATEIAMKAIEALQTIMPKELSKFFISTSGTEANEAAIKMVRQACHPAYKVISRYRSYHGSTAASITLTGDPRRWYAETARFTIPGVRFAPDSYCYRCPFDLSYPQCKIQCATYLDYMIREEGNVAAMIVEPIVGTNGRLIPPPEYYPILRRICDEQKVMLIADEVMSGWFRTGTPFAIEHWKVIPDVITTAKGASAAYTPLAVTATSAKIGQFFEEEVFCHGHTYAFHPLSAAPIPAAISELKKLMASGLPQRVSAYLKQKLYALSERHLCVGDVRGIGHFWALELVKNRKTREPFDTKADKFSGKALMTGRVSQDAMQRGVYISPWYDTLVVAPPLIITEPQIDEALNALDKSLEIADKEAVDTGTEVSHSTEYRK